MPTSLIAPLVSSAVSFGANKLLGPKGSATAPLTSFAPPGFNAGGISATYGGGGYNVAAGADRTAAVGGLAKTFGDQAGELAGLRSTVAPGFSDFRTAALRDIEDTRKQSIGNLRENLQRRRVLGSSFGQDAASRTDAEFAKQKAETEATSYLQELEASHQLLQDEFTARRGQFQTGLDEMNLEASIAASLAGKATDALSKNAQIEAQLNARAREGSGKLFGQVMQPVADAAGRFFGGGSSGRSLSSLLALGSGSGPIASPF